VSRRIAVGVSGAGSNLRALVAAGRREHGAEVALVFADRPCLALDWAAEEGIATALLPGLAESSPERRAAADEVLAATLLAASIDLVVLAGYMRIVGPAALSAFEGRIVNTHPSLLPAFPGGHAVADALAAGVTVTGCTIHLVDAVLDGGPILAQEAVAVLAGDDVETLHGRIKAVEHRLLPWTVGQLLGGALRVPEGARRAVLDTARADGAVAVPRRALLSVSDKTGLLDFGAGLVSRGVELVSTGGTARVLREAGLPVTDVAAVTGFPEMLDGRVKTLHPRIHGGILADRRLAKHRQALLAAGIAPFEIVAVNLYPFAATAERPGIGLDALVEEIDIGGPTLVRAAAKNHASVAVVTSPARYPAILAALDEPEGIGLGLRSALAIEAFRHTAAYDARIAAELPQRMDEAGVPLPVEPGLPRSEDPYPAVLVVPLEKVETLRYGENPHQPAARYRRTDRSQRSEDGPFATAAEPLQGKALSYNNVLDASAAAATARLLRGPACVVVKHTNPCGAAERPTLLEAWQAALAGDPVSAFGGVVALTGTVDRPLAEALTSLFLEVVVAPGYDDAALTVLAAKPNLRLLVDPTLDPSADRSGQASRGLLGLDRGSSIRTAGGAVLVSAADTLPDDPAGWRTISRREPTDRERSDLDLAWRLVRPLVSNAIAIVRDGMLIGIGSGQTSRVDACRQAVDKARQFQGEASLRGAVAASDAFFPFPDGPQVLLDAGIGAIVQPGGSVRDAEVTSVVDAAGAAMLATGTRHFRH
jgi:phosphoribosylaminoimidazolecarboxamide formyltransferase / IMP cyclohydrolase